MANFIKDVKGRWIWARTAIAFITPNLSLEKAHLTISQDENFSRINKKILRIFVEVICDIFHYFCPYNAMIPSFGVKWNQQNGVEKRPIQIPPVIWYGRVLECVHKGRHTTAKKVFFQGTEKIDFKFHLNFPGVFDTKKIKFSILQ